MTAATQLPEHIVRRIEMMAMSPTPSCQAFKGALVKGLALPVPALSMPGYEAYMCSALGKPVKALSFEDLPRCLDEDAWPLCHNCLDEDVWPFTGMPISTFWYWSSTGRVHSWQISTTEKCDGCWAGTKGQGAAGWP
jgi:hypothetical protein